MNFKQRLKNVKAWTLPPPVFEWIENNIPFGSRVLEFGSGIGTKRLCKNYIVTSIENDKRWLNKANSTYIYAPLKNGWYDVNVLSEALKNRKPWELIIIDGPVRKHGDREIFLKHFRHLGLDCDCPFIIDDTNTVKKISEELEEDGYLKTTITFKWKTCDILTK